MTTLDPDRPTVAVGPAEVPLPVEHPTAAAVPAEVAIRRGSRLWPLAVGALGAFTLLLALVRAGATRRVDLGVTKALQRAGNPAFRRTMRAVSWPGYPPQSRVIPPLMIGGWLAAGLPVEAATQLLGWGSALVSSGVKLLVRRPRPLATDVVVAVAPLGGSSFPSGHVLTYCGVYGVGGYLLATRVRGERARTVAAAAPLALVGLVGPSRIQQGHHWPTDVAASYLLGSAWVALCVAVHRRLVRREVATVPPAARRPGG